MKRIDLLSASAMVSLLCFLYFGTVNPSKTILMIAFLFGIYPFASLIKLEYHCISRQTKLLLMGVSLAYPLSIVNNNFSSGFMYLPMVLSSFGIAYAMVRDKRFQTFVRIILIGYLAYIIISTQVINIRSRDILLGSRNRISTLLLALGVLVLASSSKKSDILLALLIFVSCIISISSAGIVASGLLFGVILMKTIIISDNAKHKKTLISFALIVITAVIALTTIPSLLSGGALQGLSVDRLVADDVRYQVWEIYIREYMVGKSLFLGSNDYINMGVSNFQGEIVYLDNLHSSYLMIHANTGIFAVIIMAAIIWRFVSIMKYSKYLGLLMLVILLRAYSDTSFILTGYYNFAFYIFFLPVQYLADNLRKNSQSK